MKLDTKAVVGVFFIMIGILFFVEQITQIEISVWGIIGTWWPLILVYWGLNEIRNQKRSYLLPIFGIISGILLIADNLEFLPWGFWGTIWPLIFILIGIHFIFGKKSKFNLNPFEGKEHSYREKYEQGYYQQYTNYQANSQANYQTSNGDNCYDEHTSAFGSNANQVFNTDIIESNVFFSGSSNKVTSKNVIGGEVNVVFGGSELDFRDADLSDNANVIEVNAVFGGVEIYIPYNWQVEIHGTPVFGGVTNKTRFDPTYNSNNSFKSRILRINYTVIFGGIEIKN